MMAYKNSSSTFSLAMQSAQKMPNHEGAVDWAVRGVGDGGCRAREGERKMNIKWVGLTCEEIRNGRSRYEEVPIGLK